MALRIELGVTPDEHLLFISHSDVHMARRHWPDYRIEVVGLDMDKLIGEVVGPIYPPRGYEATTYGRQLLMLRMRIYWRDSPVYAQLRFRRGWPKVKDSIEGKERARNDYEVRMAMLGLELIKGVAPRGRPPDGREEELDRLARLGLRWVQVPGKGRTPDDLTWPIIAMLDNDRPYKKMKTKASAKCIRIEDVRQRARDLQAWLP